MRLPPRPDLSWKEDGTPVDDRVGDIYYSVEDGLEESRAVFLEPCGLPQRWQDGEAFTIAELGFGTGLNFLAAWQLWRAHRPPGSWLNFVSFEGFPMDAQDARQALGRWSEVSEIARKLLEQWPPRALGVHHVSWPDEQISLTLHIGEIAETLEAADLQADAWFLDGFSPARNPAMWDASLWPKLAARSKHGATVATFTVAGAVRRGLAEAGFDVAKQTGFGRKRERLSGTLSLENEGMDGVRAAYFPAPAVLRSGAAVAVLGAGVAGLFLARRLADRGARVTLFDPETEPLSGASGNPAALVMPRLDAADTPVARLLVEAYVRAVAAYRDLPGTELCETVQRPRDAGETERFAKVLADPPLGLEWLEAIRGGGLLHKQSVLVRPAALVPALLVGVETRFGVEPRLDLEQGTVDAMPFDAIILASGMAVEAHAPELGLQGRLGQVNFIESTIEAPPSALASGHYALANGRLRLWGATFAADPGIPPTVSETATSENLAALDALDPYWRQEAKAATSDARAGLRATTPDRLPAIGPLIDGDAILESHAGLRTGQAVTAPVPVNPCCWLVTGFGSRGFSWAPWAADLICARLFGDPLPTSSVSAGLVAPERQLIRDLKRGRV